MAASKGLNEKFYREYMTFFEHAEKARRWNPFTLVDWDKLSTGAEGKSEKLALCAETFCGVEMYLPDYIKGHLDLYRDNYARAWFAANWGYEESKHSLSLREWLVKSGHRTAEQMHDYAQAILNRSWKPPFETGRQMTAYGVVQEMTTFVIYKKQQMLCEAEGQHTLAELYKTIAKDEMAHTRYYEIVLGHLLDDDREGTLKDIATVFYNFTMPAYDLIPDYDSRVEVMRTAGIDRGVFLTEVWGPILKKLKLTRHDLPPVWKEKKKAASEQGRASAPEQTESTRRTSQQQGELAPVPAASKPGEGAILTGAIA